ncbi:unnamed protein product [Candidula unifasciata]|uniref:Solute carrier family 43 member 3 n=1 Tax=Candidula unifasciata TaxID=100452 RepID=A0A8S3YNC1_9EUPU|nr:unnamed protein product [Candidula unifasciata]
MTPGNPKYRFLYAVWGFLECLGFGGLIYGWGSLVYILKDEGLYLDLCPLIYQNDTASFNSTGVSNVTSIVYQVNQTLEMSDIGLLAKRDPECSDRNKRLALAFTVAMAMFCVGCFILGQVNFKFGIRVTRLAAAVVFIVGALAMAFLSNDTPFLLFPGLSMLGAGGIAYLVTNMQLSMLFPKGGSAVVGLMCGGFDASSGVQLLIKIGYENGISRQTSYIILACTHLLTLISTFFFLPKGFFKKPPAHGPDEVAGDTDVAVKLTSKTKGADDEEREENKPSLRKCMLSPVYILHVVWLSILQLRFYFFLGSLNVTLETILTSNSKVSHYTNVFMYILMCGLFTSPFAGVVCDFFSRLFATSESLTRRQLMPLVFPLALTTTLCIVMSGLILSEDPTTLYAVFVFLLFFRSFMYTLAAGLIGAVFPGEFFGIMYGILIITGGIISMFQYALFDWAEATEFMQVNLFLTIFMVITYVHPVYLWFTCRRAETSESFTVRKQ